MKFQLEPYIYFKSSFYRFFIYNNHKSFNCYFINFTCKYNMFVDRLQQKIFICILIKSINIDTKDAIKNLKKYINVCTASFHSIANLTNIKGE